MTKSQCRDVRAPGLVLVGLGLLLASACQDSGPSPPYLSEVLSHTGPGIYAIEVEPLETLVDFEQLSGAAASFRGGGYIRISLNDDALTEAELRHAARVRGDHDIHLDYVLDDGVVQARDYDTFAMLSLYRALERVRAFFLGLGVEETALPTLPVYFRPRLEVSVFPLLASSNAAYSPPVDGFLFFNDFFDGAEVPLALNLGVVAHEYGHAVWQHLVWKDRLPDWALVDWPSLSVNHLRALDEGLCDFFGATLTNDPQFVGRSVPELLADRDLDQRRSSFAAGSLSADPAFFDPYRLGSVIASALWEAGDFFDRQLLARHLIAAHRQTAGRVGSDFRLAEYLDRVVAITRAHDPNNARELCGVLKYRMSDLGPFPCCEGACP